MSLKLGSSIYTYLWDYPIEEALKRLAGMGFRYVEIMCTPPHVWIGGMDKQDRKALREVLDSCQLELVSMNPSYGSNLNLASTLPEIREDSVVRVKDTIELTHELGGQIVIVVPGILHPLMPAPFEMAWGWAGEGIEGCAEHAEKYDVTIALENVSAFRFFDTVGLMKRMVEEVGSDHVRLLYDVANASKTEHRPAAIRELGDYIALVHLSDISNGWGHLPIGMGIIDFGPIADSLRAIDFQGVSILEMTYPQASDGGILASASRLEALGWKR